MARSAVATVAGTIVWTVVSAHQELRGDLEVESAPLARGYAIVGSFALEECRER